MEKNHSTGKDLNHFSREFFIVLMEFMKDPTYTLQQHVKQYGQPKGVKGMEPFPCRHLLLVLGTLYSIHQNIQQNAKFPVWLLRKRKLP